ncbi:MAG: redoxin domain-containing protein [Balneolaceae bacterium]
MTDIGETVDLDFHVRAVISGEEKEVLFTDLLGDWTVVTVYMRNNTSGCDRQNRSLAAEQKWFQQRGVTLIAISKDGCRSHRRYAEKIGIDYVLVSDPDHRFAEATDSIVEKKMYGKTFEGPSRSAWLLDREGVLRGRIEKIDTKDHASEVQALVQMVQERD